MDLGRLDEALEKFLGQKSKNLYVLLKNGLRMVLGRLVKALEKFFVITRPIWSTSQSHSLRPFLRSRLNFSVFGQKLFYRFN